MPNYTVPNHTPIKKQMYLIRKKGTNVYRAGTNKYAIPKLYYQSPGLMPDEEMVRIELVIGEAKLSPVIRKFRT